MIYAQSVNQKNHNKSLTYVYIMDEDCFGKIVTFFRYTGYAYKSRKDRRKRG